MDIVLLIKALLLGIVEGLTEFLPISSTGHLIVAGDLINFHDSSQVFEVAIQLGAVLAVVFEYRQRFSRVMKGIGRDREVNRFVFNLGVAFMPAAVVGLIFSKQIKHYLFNPITVAIALVVGGLIIFLIEKYQKNRPPKVTDVDKMNWKDALTVGLAQILALIPGTSRSGSTIMGGMAFGLSRTVATEFSFFLSVPIMFAATFYDIYKNHEAFTSQSLGVISVGFIAAFISGLLAVRALLKFVSTNTFIPFAWYRIIFGIFILISWQFNWINWSL
jgi:undecaprenyl-diphosphatase